jgi:hypothetical protein
VEEIKTLLLVRKAGREAVAVVAEAAVAEGNK